MAGQLSLNFSLTLIAIISLLTSTCSCMSEKVRVKVHRLLSSNLFELARVPDKSSLEPKVLHFVLFRQASCGISQNPVEAASPPKCSHPFWGQLNFL